MLLRAPLEGEAGCDDKTVLTRSAISVGINHVVGVSLHARAIGRREIDDTDVENRELPSPLKVTASQSR
jgi:hypothetical protein